MGGIGSGGARDGAGRKMIDGEPRMKVSVTLPVSLVSFLRDRAMCSHISTSQLITELIKKGLSI
ncbi:MAG: hypothetical protein K2F78_02130 [Muribaculaceae bacterium]|nr:hypothetical protein [Muribaculaceae bacterium]